MTKDVTTATPDFLGTPEKGETKFFPDLMVDVESTGVDTAVNAMVQIACRPFNAETGEVSPNSFEVCLHVPEGRTWQQSNIDWWNDSEDKKATLKYIRDNRENWWDGMEKFKQFVLANCQEIGVRFWSNHTLDWEFMQSYMFEYGWANPFHFSNTRELNSVIAGILDIYDRKSISATRPLLDKSKTHDAVYDVDWQINWLLRVKQGKEYMEKTQEVVFEGYSRENTEEVK